jgi:hypothetical protein
MSWSEPIELELRRAEEAERIGNHGRARTCARRAVGLAISELMKSGLLTDYENDFMRQVRRLANDEAMNQELRDAAKRLSARIAEDFSAQSTKPIEDAKIILHHLALLQQAQSDSSER